MKYDEFLHKLEIAAAQKAIDKAVVKYNSRPIDDFCGLSSHQMTSLLRHAGSDGSAIAVRDGISDNDLDRVPIFRVVEEMLRIALRDGKLELTKLGYLKRKVLRELYALGFFPDTYIDEKPGALSELDWRAASIARGVLEVGRWIRTYKGNAVPTKLGKDLAAAPRDRFFREVFEVMTYRMYWRLIREYPELAPIQDCSGFSFWLIDRFGAEWRTADFYGDKFLTAFPTALPDSGERPIDTGIDEIMRIVKQDNPGLFRPKASKGQGRPKPAPIDLDSPAARKFKSYYGAMTFEHHMSWLGIVETKGSYLEPKLVRKTVLFDKLLRLDVPA